MKNFKKYNEKILTFYTPKMACTHSNIVERSYSKSPRKPLEFVQRCLEKEPSLLTLTQEFKPLTKVDFIIAHTREYVDDFFNGESPLCESNNLPWSENLAESVTYTNGALYAAIKFAIGNPNQITLAPVSGMHHATPTRGGGFCTFSGQVISSIKILKEFGVSGAYLDLDGHFGNSIEDTRGYTNDINIAVPIGYNVNPYGTNASYCKDLEQKLKSIGRTMLQDNVKYIVFAHGADSHTDDDMGGSCDAKYWMKNAVIVAQWIKSMNEKLNLQLPVILALFGGYRADDYNEVLDLHIASIKQVRDILSNE